MTTAEKQTAVKNMVSEQVTMLATDIVTHIQSLEAEDEGLSEVMNELRSEIDEDPEIEIFEWYFVNEWFADRLKEEGEIIIEYFNNPLWGRQTSGQAIALDSVVEKIWNEYFNEEKK